MSLSLEETHEKLMQFADPAKKQMMAKVKIKYRKGTSFRRKLIKTRLSNPCEPEQMPC